MPPVGINSGKPGTGTPQEDSDPTKSSPLANLQPDASNLLTPANSLKQEKPGYWPKPFQPKLPNAKLHASASTGTGMGNYQRNFEARSRQQFQVHMQKADELLQKGKYYRAADAYGSAIVYDFTSGAAHQGKAHALFGAGEYMSSAYFLYQALKLDPKLALSRTDLRKMFADENKFPRRLKELNDWQTKSNAAELKFLQGYVLYQIGSRDQAKTLLTDALNSNPTLKAIEPILKALATEKKLKIPKLHPPR
jgi:tetratricopeptide (TPR) repeat protein